jgi:cytochrome c oxidase cbb3-type subunit 3
MRIIHLIKKVFFISLIALLTVSTAMAQEAKTAAEKTVTSDNNQLEILLIIMMVVLVFVIWGMGRVLMALSREVLNKNKSAGKALTVLLVMGLLFTSHASTAQDVAASEAVKVLPNYGGLTSSAFNILLTVFVTEVIIILFLAYSISRLYAELLPQKQAAPAKSKKSIYWWTRLNKKLTRAVPLEKEADVMLDHDYDGIRELDNPLPPWWKYGFYITIVVGVIYLLNFHVFGYGKNPTEEYATEMGKARIEKELYEANNKDKIDENNVPMADAAGLLKAKEIFTTKCWACHGKLGEGGAGPNLTDDYWLHKESLNDIYQTIKNGYPDKGMQSWAAEFTPKEIGYLASYIKKLHNTNPPNPKAPQGDLYHDASSPSPVADSVKEVKPETSMSNKTVIDKTNPDNKAIIK